MNEQSLMTLIRERRSIRRYSGKPVENSTIEAILEAARWAPSNHNRQAWKFVVIQDRATIEKMRGIVEDRVRALSGVTRILDDASAAELLRSATLFAEAPVVILAMHRRPAAVSLACLEGVPDAEIVSGELISSAMAGQNVLLTAHSAGLGTCVMTAPLIAATEIKRLLDIPSSYQLTALVALGYPAERPAPPRRKPLDQIVEYVGGGE